MKLYIVFCGLIFLSCNSLAQNLALHKNYTLSVSPNYPYAAPATDKTSLTDGIYTTGRFWTQPTTVGWQLQGVTVTIDLEKIEPISAITFNTVRSQDVGISFPQNIFVFISRDNKNFNYVGDAADVPDNLPGGFQVKKFELNKIDQSARYITLTVVPQGQFLFCDEIEIIKATNTDIGTSQLNLIPMQSLSRVVDSLKLPKHNRRILARSIEKLQNVSNANKIRLKVNNQFSTIRSELNNRIISGNNLLSIKEQIQRENAANLKERYNSAYILWKCNPWDTLTEFDEPNESFNMLRYQFVVEKNDVQYGSFVITNSNLSPQKFSFKISNNSSFNRIELYDVPFVPSSYYSLIPDPLVIIKDSETIDAGVSKMFIFKITGIKRGFTNSTITVSSRAKNTEINISTHILDLFYSNNIENLNVNVWAYFNSPMLKGHEKEVEQNLQEHHVNTLVIPPAFLPDMETKNYDKLVNYLSNFKNAKNILLFMDYSSAARKSGYKGGQYMSAEWKSNFILWYNNIIKSIHENCSLAAQVYLYPFDEVANRNIEDFTKLIVWVKETMPSIKFFATVNTQEGMDSILPLVDIAQTLPSNYGLKMPSSHQSEIWVYSGITPSRSLPPYQFYRLMAWDAFVNDYKGIGFWNYADERNGNALNLISDSLPNLAGSYSVIYNAPDGSIITSRRWEAFRLGIEDYSILKAYSKKYGIQRAKALAKQVVNTSEDLNLADTVRNKILMTLSGN